MLEHILGPIQKLLQNSREDLVERFEAEGDPAKVERVLGECIQTCFDCLAQKLRQMEVGGIANELATIRYNLRKRYNPRATAVWHARAEWTALFWSPPRPVCCPHRLSPAFWFCWRPGPGCARVCAARRHFLPRSGHGSGVGV